MKMLNLLSLVIFTCFSSYAQDPQLFENDWYLQKVNIADVDYFPPYSNFSGRLYLNPDTIEVVHPSCEEGFQNIIDYIPSNDFNIGDGGVVIIGTCGDPDIIDFINKHYSIYYLENDIAKNPFSYTLTTENGIITLTIVNNDEDQAIYTNELLSIQTFNASSFEIYPNPVTNKLFISTISDFTNFNVIIFDLNGKRILSLVGSDVINKSIDIQKLNDGLYFIMLEDNQGQTTIKKFIKY